MKYALLIILIFELFACNTKVKTKSVNVESDPVTLDVLDTFNREENRNSLKKSFCDFEIIFDLDKVDDVDRCSFSFLILDEMKFENLHYTETQNKIKIIGKLLHTGEGDNTEFPVLWIQKKIKGQESFQGVHNLYVHFETDTDEKLRIRLKNMCKIEHGLIVKITKSQKMHCYNYIPKDFETWRLFLNTLDIPKRAK